MFSYKLDSVTRKWLFVIIALGIVVRLIVGYVQPATVDEGHTFYVTKGGISQIIDEMRLDVHPPTLNFLLLPLVKCTNSIFLLRLPHIFLGGVTIFLVFLLCQRYYSDKTALWITACFAFSRGIWIIDTTIRFYGPLTCMSMALVLGALTIVQYGSPYAPYLSGHKRWQWPLFIFACLGCSTLHACGVLLMFTIFVFFLAPKLPISKSLRWRTLVTLAITVLPIIAWVAYVILSCPNKPPRTMGASSLVSLIYMPNEVLNGLSANVLFTNIPTLQSIELLKTGLNPLFIITDAFIWGLFVYGAFVIDVKRNNPTCSVLWERLFLVCAFLGPCFFLFLANYLQMLSWQSRYVAPFLGVFLLVCCAGVRSGRKFLIGTALLVNVIELVAFPTNPWLWNNYWKTTLDFIEAHQSPNDHIALYLPATCYSFSMAYDIENINYIFTNNAGASLVMVNQNPRPGKLTITPFFPELATPQFINGRFGQGKVFFIVCQPQPEMNDMVHNLNKYYAVQDSFTHNSVHFWGTVTTYLLERRPETLPVTNQGN